MKNTHKLYTDVIAKSGSKNEPLEVTANGTYEAPIGIGYSPVNVNVPQVAQGGSLKAVLDATKSAHYLFNDYRGTSVDTLINSDDTENVTDMQYMFTSCINLTSIPQLDASKVTNTYKMFDSCFELTSIGIYGFTRSISINETALEHDAIVAFLNQAGTAYNSSQKITMGSAKLALLSDEEKAIATNKGWTLA